jgi:polyferredoxin
MIFQNSGMSFNLITALPMFLLWIAVSIVALLLINKGKLNKKYSLIIYTVVVVLGGVILGGVPNAVLPIQTILSAIGVSSSIIIILPMIIILIILLLTVLLFGRIFCGFVCPVGALQEFISKINFKSNIKKQKDVKYKIDISLKTANIIRWIFFGVIIILAIFWSFSVLQIINPFSGFKIFTNPLAPLFLIPGITLIIVAIASFFVYRPWCRLFCPFGMLASVIGRFSQKKYIRTEDCNECGSCEKICPTHQAERDSKKEECYYCNRCVDVCPQDAIKLGKRFKIQLI